ncbi:hypothetical protein B0H10DRAFT_925954 [Mycena sp. CBHHK59/15]|nr:hypothetical protein B0H10DRAFT_925954 [Mycena sp. CBHHK59/15]
MNRKSKTVAVVLATFASLCQAAPLDNGGRRSPSSSNTSSTSTSPVPPSATQQNATSTPSLTSVPNFAAYTNGTIGWYLNEMLVWIDHDAPNRWVTAQPISSTMLGSQIAANSNADLSEQVDMAFSDGVSRQGWVDTYIDFLIEAGQANASWSDDVQVLLQQSMNATAAFAAEQVKLVNAYTAAHPNNVTYVGVDIANVSRVDGITMEQMEYWASLGGDANSTLCGGLSSNSSSSSDAGGTSKENCTLDAAGPYTKEDYNTYLAVASTAGNFQIQIASTNEEIQMALRGHMLKQALTQFGIFNLSMETGGEGLSARFAPAWSATIIAVRGKTSPEILTPLDSGLAGGLGNSSDKDVLGIISRNGAIEGRQSTQGFSVVEFIAHGMKSASSKAPSASTPFLSTDIEQLTPTNIFNQSIGEQALVLLAVQEGSWSDQRDDFIKFARYHFPDIAGKYFGVGTSGAGPIGRHWTHIALLMTVESVNGSTQASEVQTLGRVYDVLPVLSYNMK